MPDLRDTLFADLDHEFDATRRTLAAVPWDRDDWAPHDKSMTLGALARHVATLPRFGLMSLTSDAVDMAEIEMPQDEIASTDDLLAVWDETSAALRGALAQASDDDLGKPWTMTMRGNPLVSGQRHHIVRQWSLSHIAHHRGQLTVYLRMLDVPVPGVYGPSADDKARMAGA